MSSDLFDAAKPVRDATMAEYERQIDPNAAEVLQSGFRLGLHLQAVMMAATMKRINGAEGAIESDGLLHYLSLAIAQTLSYCAVGFRPMQQDGTPVTPQNNLVRLCCLVGGYAMHQVQMAEQGQQDFNVAFQLDADGEIKVKPFDFMNMLKGGAS